MVNFAVRQRYQPPWVMARVESLLRMTPSGPSDTETGERPGAETVVHTFNGMTPGSSARKLARIHAARDLTSGVSGAADLLSGGPPELAFIDERKGFGAPRKQQKPMPADPSVLDQMLPNITGTAPVGPGVTDQPGDPWLGPQAPPVEPGTPGPVPKSTPAAPDPATTLGISPDIAPPAPAPAGALPDVLTMVDNGPLQPGQTLALPSGTTMTGGNDGTTAVSTTDPTTGITRTRVTDRNGTQIATAESEPVPGTGGASRATTIVDAHGVTRVHSVADGHGNVTTWTANPDGSHSVRYPDGLIVKEPAPGTTTPAEYAWVRPDGLGGHSVVFNHDGSLTRADWALGALAAPVTDIANPDGSHTRVATVPGQTDGAPFSIITAADGSRTILQPDGTSVPIDRYNNVIGGPNYGNQFDPTTGTWRTDPVTHRGPITTAPDGTSSQQWFYLDAEGTQRFATALFDSAGYLTQLQDGDYTGLTVTQFGTYDGIILPLETNRLDAGNVEDDRRIVFETVLAFAGIPELGWTLGRTIGTRFLANRLARYGTTVAGVELLTSSAVAPRLTSLTGSARSRSSAVTLAGHTENHSVSAYWSSTRQMGALGTRVGRQERLGRSTLLGNARPSLVAPRTPAVPWEAVRHWAGLPVPRGSSFIPWGSRLPVDAFTTPAGAQAIRDLATEVPRGALRAIHAGSAPPTVLKTVFRREYRDVLHVNVRNYVGRREGFDINCTRCVVATDYTLAGSPASALGVTRPGNIFTVSDALGGTWYHMSGYNEIVRRVLQWGPGSRGVVGLGRGPGRVGHVFNVVYDHNGVVFIDGQVGGFAYLETVPSLHLLRTA